MTKIRQLTQAWNSGTYTDNTAPTLADFETNPVDLETDLNNLRSQVNNLLNAQTGNWYDNPFIAPTFDLPITGTSSLNNVPIGCFTSLLTDITVSNAQNWQILDVSSSEAPTIPGSLANTTEGVIVAQSADSGGAFDAFELTERAGSSAIAPNNLCIVRDATTFQPIQSSGRDIFALIQVESTFTDGDTFNDVPSGDRVKLSFVRYNAAGTDLELCPVADIENKDIQYNYPSIVFFKNIDPSCFTGNRGYVDQAASVDVTLQNAYNNGNTIATASATDIAFSGPDGGGGFTVATVDAVSVGTANATTADTSGTKLTLSSGDGLGVGDGGDVSIAGGASGADATGNGGPVSITAGTAGSTSGNGGDVILTAGASTGANQGGLVTLSAGSSATGQNGFINITTAADEDEVQLLITPSGTGATVGLYSGANSPDTVVTATAGSLFMRSNGQVWVNDDGATSWVQLSTGSVEDRQDVYDNQGAIPVDLTTNAILDLEGPGLAWSIRDDLQANLFVITEGSAGGTSSVQIGADADTFNVDSPTQDFDGTTFDVLMTGAVSIDAGAASNLTASAGNMTLESTAASALIVAGTEADITAGTLVDINAGTAVDIDATTTVAIDTANAADASGNSVTITAGSSTAGTADGANIVLTPGDGFTTGAAGFVNITSPADEDEALLQLEATGTNGETVQMFAGSSDPNVGLVSANRGSLFMRDTGTTGQLWINTSAAEPGTSWTQLQAGAAETRQDVYDNQGAIPVDLTTNATLDLEGAGLIWSIRDDAEANLFAIREGSAGGTSEVQIGSDADTFNVDSPTQDFDGDNFTVDMTAAISLDAGAASNFTTSSGDLTLSTADASTGNVLITAGNEAAAAGNNVTITSGSATAGNNNGGISTVNGGDGFGTGNGGDVDVTAGDGGATGDGGAVTVNAGAATGGTGGAITISSGASTGGNSGLLTISVPDTTAAATTADNIDITGGAGTTTGGGSTINITAGDGGAGLGSLAGDVIVTAGAAGAATSTGGGVTITTGANVSGSSAGDLNLATTTNAAGGDVGDIILTGANIGLGGTGAGGDITLLAGNGAATGTGGQVVLSGNYGGLANGSVTISTNSSGADPGSLISEADPVVIFDNQGAGAGGGQSMSLFTGSSDPNVGLVSANRGSVFLRDTGATGQVWVNTSVAEPGTTWTQLLTGASVEDRQDVYDNQGAIPVDLTTNATLDLEGAGLIWSIRDDAEADLFAIREGSAGGTSQVQIGSDADTFNVDSPTQDFDGDNFTVDMTAAISLDAAAASNLTTSAGNMTLESTAASALIVAGTEADITAGTTVDINAGTTVTIDAADIADASGNFVTIDAGTSTGAGNNGGAISITTGAGNGAAQGGAMTLSTPDTSDTAAALSGAISIRTGGTPFLGSNGSSGNIDVVTGTGSDSSVQAGRITLTTGSAGAGSGAIGGLISITAGNSDATGEGGTMGDVSITAGNNAGTDDAGDVTIATGANTSAGGAAGTMALNVGASTGAIAGSSVSINAGDAGATGATGGNVVVTTGAAAGGDAGFFYVDTDNDDDEHVVELSTSGTQGSDTQMLVGTTDPSGVVAARPSSLYFLNTKAVDGTPGELYLNVSDVVGESTVWSQIQTASTVTTFTYASGVATGGGIPANTDISDLAAASNITLDANSPSFPTFPATAALFFSLCKVWVNGLLQRNGAAGSVVRSGTQSTAIQLNFALVDGDEVAIELRSA